MNGDNYKDWVDCKSGASMLFGIDAMKGNQPYFVAFGSNREEACSGELTFEELEKIKSKIEEVLKQKQ